MKDSEFLRGESVPMTKREVRSVVLERLELHRASRFVDVGAGTGSVAIEAAIRHPNLNILAIEKKPQALDLINDNCRKFGCEQIRIVNETAPCEITGHVDAIFIGGSGGNLTDIIDWALEHLVANGRLVLSFILQDNLSEALQHIEQCEVHDVECVQLLVSNKAKLGKGYYFKPNNPTFVLSCQKGKGE
ncbi:MULTISPECIES: decarboxylating cobalt-precorrin-6B (C(15))-methyltransferase [Vibrio]|uniref:Decarboxylating cobalt-precorrin-6B (C(15))-methyltransferase n=2 Tax=Vibrio TaxID=662 RepID=A0A7X4LK73_9VIBR|nr:MULTISPECIES: decarboxylating cobalt-precorrin-6B (C(15))-methyltransferase [Vibrio]MBF9002592.1 decarboxylating cobalt-precorrin-6B (C(15))-methyltransferase [Vibrio nitrifigilis]MZI93356.1 decarboxylating cobalt-precorrin-6B (C(15))-methyltransferase [Vibrio eleionomae]